MRSRDVRALAIDYDRTLTTPDLRRVPRALGALARARAAGGKVVVVSGRGLAFLEHEVGHVADALVAENGCFLRLPDAPARRLGPETDIGRALAELAIPLERGDAFASADVEHEPLLRDALARAGVAADLVRNRDRVMVLPRGVDKALGVVAALEALGIPPQRAAAIGDGENDVPLLQAVGLRLAVANAVEELKLVAHHVTRASGGDGVAEWIEGEWIPALEVVA